MSNMMELVDLARAMCDFHLLYLNLVGYVPVGMALLGSMVSTHVDSVSERMQHTLDSKR